jgi:type I restriction enzyme S subunit
MPAVYIDTATNRLLTRSVLRADDVLMVIAGATTGKVAIIRDEQLPANTNQAVAFIRPKAKDAPQFLYYWLSSQLLQEEVWLNAVQAAQPNLSLEDIGNFIMPFPPLPEQHTIATLLDRETAKIDTLTAEIEAAIAHLEEYRTALISAAVTGKIDVRDALPSATATQLPLTDL